MLLDHYLGSHSTEQRAVQMWGWVWLAKRRGSGEKEGLCHAWGPWDLSGEGSQKRGWVCARACMRVAVRAHVGGASLGSPPRGY